MSYDPHSGVETYMVSGDKFVCGRCLGNAALVAVVEDNLEAQACSYCGRTSKKDIAAPLQAVVDHIAECIAKAYNDPVDELPFESADGGYLGHTLDAHDLLDNIGFEAEWQDLRNDVAYAFSDHQWCRNNYYSATDLERLQWGWDDFKKVIKHERR